MEFFKEQKKYLSIMPLETIRVKAINVLNVFVAHLEDDQVHS